MLYIWADVWRRCRSRDLLFSESLDLRNETPSLGAKAKKKKEKKEMEMNNIASRSLVHYSLYTPNTHTHTQSSPSESGSGNQVQVLVCAGCDRSKSVRAHTHALARMQ